MKLELSINIRRMMMTMIVYKLAILCLKIVCVCVCKCVCFAHKKDIWHNTFCVTIIHQGSTRLCTPLLNFVFDYIYHKQQKLPKIQCLALKIDPSSSTSSNTNVLIDKRIIYELDKCITILRLIFGVFTTDRNC